MLGRGLYAIADADVIGRSCLDFLQFIGAVLAAKPAVLQVRAKHLDARAYLDVLLRTVELAAAHNVPVFANDRPDLAWLSGCQGVHVGQTDLPVDLVRRCHRHLAVGVSTHSIEQLTEALALCPDYVAIGPVYDTSSKVNPEATIGEELLEQARRLSAERRIPLVAIGGINLERARVVRQWADYVAVISALVPTDGRMATVTKLARQLHETICND